MYTRKIAITFDHILRAIMALDHSRLGLDNKSGRIFWRSTSLIYKILPTSLGTCKPTFYPFHASHLRWNSTMRRCFYHTDLGQNAILQYKFHSFNIEDDRSKRGLLAKPLKKFPKSPIWLAGSHFWLAPYAYTLQHNKFCLFFILWFYNDL